MALPRDVGRRAAVVAIVVGGGRGFTAICASGWSGYKEVSSGLAVRDVIDPLGCNV